MRRSKPLIVIVLLIILYLILLQVVSIWSNYRWFAANSFQHAFWVLFLTRYGVGLAALLVFFLLFRLNFWWAGRSLPRLQLHEAGSRVVELVQSPLRNLFSGNRGKKLFLLFSALMALIIAIQAGSGWETVQKFFYATPFGTTDPVFGRDIAFYIFKLPFYEMILSLLTAALVLMIIVSLLLYVTLAVEEFGGGGWKVFSPVKLHLGVLAAAGMALKAWSYHLATYRLLFSAHNSFDGISFTDLHARIPALNILTMVALLAAVFVCVGIARGKIRPLVIGIVGLLAASLVVGGIYPYMIQKLQVEPNEFSREKTYISYNMEATRAAYGLDKVKLVTSSASDDTVSNVSQKTLQSYHGTLINLRLWDYHPLAQVYNQIQQLRRYYTFNDVDVDRYQVGPDYRQVMLSARELDPDNLPDQAQTWVNRKLQYTHGFGAVASPVNEVTGDGLPSFTLQDIPPQSTAASLAVTKPQIYFGEKTGNMVVVNTKQGEFDYPQGDKNVYASYQGHGGVQLSNWLRRLAYAIKFQDIKLLLSSDITSNSRILYNRAVSDIQRVAPYLQYDGDPYLVISGGRLYWMQDAYTVSDHYPYSQNNEGINYIRNSVKVVMDAYQGDIRFYVADPADPLIKTYMKIFPDVYRPLSQMPAGLKQHIRYPEGLFKVQTPVYALYHIDDPRVFYNREDQWEIPDEKTTDGVEQIQPYYAIMQLPGESKEEYVLVLPYTPVNRQNLVAWMAARCDGAHYGQLEVDVFSKDVHVYGPMQVEATIDQNGEISSQLTLWSQHGSSVIRGNLITVPLAGRLLYVEPLFLQAQDSSLPQLTRVIAFYEGNVVMEKDLATAINSLFKVSGTQPQTPQTSQTEPQTGEQQSAAQLAKEANDLYNQAQAKLKAGDWSGYGQVIGKLGRVLQQLTGLNGGQAATE